MSQMSQPPDRVPTLTEVVAWPEPAAAPGAPIASAEAAPGERPGDRRDEGHTEDRAEERTEGRPAALNEDQLTQRVLIDLQRQIDLMLDYRLREVLTPLLTRAADGIVREVRAELAPTLRDLVSRAVALELARHRGG